MKDSQTIERDRQLTSYLHFMQALQAEMTVAMDCIARHALAPLQESIARQEALCAELAAVAKKLNGRLIESDPAIAGQVRAATKSLRQTNSDYSAVLKHSGRTLALLSSLHSTHTGHLPGHLQEARGSRPKYQTWSCEI